MKQRKANCIGQILCKNCLLKHVIEGKIDRRVKMKEDEEEDVSSYLITLRKREHIAT